MKNLIKIGFLALSFGLFAVACGGAATENATDSTATEASSAIDSAANAATSTVDSVAAQAQAAVDSAAASPSATAGQPHHQFHAGPYAAREMISFPRDFWPHL